MKNRRLIAHNIFIILLLFCSTSCYAWCIITPPTDAPYYKIIESIIQGIEHIIQDTQKIANTSSIPSECFEPFHNGVILLGPDPYTTQKNHLQENSTNIVVAATPEENSKIDHWIQYTPSPEVALKKTKEIEKNLKKIHIVSDKKLDPHYEKSLIQALEKNNITLEKHPIKNQKRAEKKFKSIIKKLDRSTEALWVSPNHTSFSLNPLLIPIIKHSLHYQKMTIANNISWIDKGIYLGVYPDNISLGKQIAAIALEAQKNAPKISKIGQKKSHIHYIEALKIMSNKKTIRFIDKSLSEKTLDKIDLLLPRK